MRRIHTESREGRRGRKWFPSGHKVEGAAPRATGKRQQREMVASADGGFMAALMGIFGIGRRFGRSSR